MNPGRVPHNKSGRLGLSIVDLSDADFQSLGLAFQAITAQSELKLCLSPCRIVTSPRDGRLTLRQRKVAYAYQYVARVKFGDRLREVSSAKSEPDALTISHVCGTHHCVNAEHIVLESKVINDERTMCHFVMTEAKRKGVLDNLRELRVCPHEPICGST